MSGIKLIKLTASGKNAEPAIIEFGSKLTIIGGPSDSGKTYIFKAISYLFGAKNDAAHIPFDDIDAEMYDTLTLEFENGKDHFTFERNIHSNSTKVISTNESIPNGEYKQVPSSKKNDKLTINDILLKIVGIAPDLILPAKVDGTTEHPTWRTFKDMFMINEETADRTKSVFFSQHKETLLLSCIIYMITGDTLDDYKNDKDTVKIRKARRLAVTEYINKQIDKNKERKSKLEEELKSLDLGESPDEIINSISQKLEEITHSIDEAVTSSKMIATEIINCENKIAKYKTIVSRYTTLNSQYNADIDRLSFIVESEEKANQTKKTSKCPFCEHTIEPGRNASYIAASKAELNKAVNSLNDLSEAKADILDKLDDTQAMLEHYKEEKAEIEKLLNNDLLPEKEKMATLLENYKRVTTMETEMSLLADNDNTYTTDLQEYNVDDVKSKNYKPKEFLIKLIKVHIVENCKEILKKVGFTPIESVDFDEKELDLVINGKDKANRGKGYRSFYNTLLLLCFRKYFNENSVINPRFYFFDSPLKGLFLPDNIISEENFRTGFFDYLANCNEADQMIIIENTNEKELPQIKQNDGINIYLFSGKENVGRSGFLNGIRKK